MHKYQKFIKPFLGLLIVFSLLASGMLLAPSTKVEAQANLASSNEDFLWARSMGGAGWENGRRIEVDPSGNVYTTGAFEGTADFDPGAGTFNLTSMGAADIFISKLDGNGNFLWAIQMGGTGDDYGVDLYLTPGGDLYITGAFNATVDFDPGAGTFNLTSTGYDDIFIARYNSSGALVWAKAIGGTRYDVGGEISMDAENYLVVVGAFEETVDFDPGVGTFNLTSAGYNDVFVLKMDADGNFLWAKRMGGITGDDNANGMGLDSAGNIYVTGLYQGVADFDPGAADYNLTSVGGNDIFICKLDKNGSFVWAKSVGGAGTDDGLNMVIDAGNNIYTTGYFNGTADFDPGAGTFELTSAGLADGFLLKLDGNGTFLWAKDIGGTAADYSQGVAVDSNANIYTTGMFRGTVDFDPGAGTFNLTSAGGNDIFISRLDGNGSFQWATGFGGSTHEMVSSIHLDAGSNIYLTGRYSGTVDFDPGSGTSNLTSVGDDDIFISKFGSAATFVDVPSSHMFHNYIEAFYKAGITTGCSQNPKMYCPYANVTRAEMAVFLERAMGNFSPAPSPSGMFADVPSDFWASKFVDEYYNDGVTTGCAKDPLRYCPNNNVTRQEMAVFIERALGNFNPSPSPSGNFADVPAPGAPQIFTAFIDQFYNDGITTGCAVNPRKYCPLNNVTRQEMAVFIVRAFHIPLP